MLSKCATLSYTPNFPGGIVLLDAPLPRAYAPGEESAFKKDVLTLARGYGFGAYETENEEKEPGWPDAIITSSAHCVHSYLLFEFKVSDASAVITFEKTQPRFYKTHTDLPIYIIAYNAYYNKAYVIAPSVIVEGRSLKYLILAGGESKHSFKLSEGAYK